jgi:hypothetical protein
MNRLKFFNKLSCGFYYFKTIMRDLEKVRTIIKEATGLDVMYAYDDLVFPEHAAFLIQFDDEQVNNYLCYFYEDCTVDSKNQILESLTKVCMQKKCTLVSKGAFSMKQKGKELQINFL